MVCAYIPRTSSNELPLGKLNIPLLHNGETQVPQKGIYRISLHTQRNFQVHPISLRMTWIQPTKAALVAMLRITINCLIQPFLVQRTTCIQNLQGFIILQETSPTVPYAVTRQEIFVLLSIIQQKFR